MKNQQTSGKEHILLQGTCTLGHYFYVLVDHSNPSKSIIIDVEGYVGDLCDSIDTFRRMTIEEIENRAYGIWMLGAQPGLGARK